MQINNIDLKSYAQIGIDFSTYYRDIMNVIENGESNHEFHAYYSLNSQRMERLIKKIKISENHIDRLDQLNKKITLLIITEGWCGDAAQIIPVIEKMEEASDFLEAKIVYRDDNEDLMDAYLTQGGKSIPIIIGMDEANGEELFRWGPRPEFGNELLKTFKNGEITKEEFQLELQKAYNKDKGRTIIEELLIKLEL